MGSRLDITSRGRRRSDGTIWRRAGDWLTGRCHLAAGARVAVCGPASWNHLIVLDRLPEPVPHMQFAPATCTRSAAPPRARRCTSPTSASTSRLHALLGDDEDGATAASARLERRACGRGVSVRAHRTSREPDDAGGGAGESLPRDAVVRHPSTRSSGSVRRSPRRIVAVVDLSEVGAAARRARLRRCRRRADLDGPARLRRVVGVPRAVPARRRCRVHERRRDRRPLGADADAASTAVPRLAVCTLGARGAVALAAVGDAPRGRRASRSPSSTRTVRRRVLRRIPGGVTRRCGSGRMPRSRRPSGGRGSVVRAPASGGRRERRLSVTSALR